MNMQTAVYLVDRISCPILTQRESPIKTSSYHLREIKSADSILKDYLSEALFYRLCNHFKQERIAPNILNQRLENVGFRIALPSLQSYDLSLILVLLSKISLSTNVTAARKASSTAAEKAASVLYCL
jgi:hypothetical protein